LPQYWEEQELLATLQLEVHLERLRDEGDLVGLSSEGFCENRCAESLLLQLLVHHPFDVLLCPMGKWRMTSTRVRLASIGLAFLLTTLLSSCGSDDRPRALGDYDRCESQFVNAVTCSQMFDVVAEQQGPVLMMLYSSGCPLSQQFMPEFVDLSERYSDRGVAALAFSTDDCAKHVDAFMTGVPLEPYWIEPWEEGELGDALLQLGVDLPLPWTRPYVVIVGKDGTAKGQWNGAMEFEVPEIESILEAELQTN